MCIDLFAPGRCLDVDFLCEQIWLELDPDRSPWLKITEVYDLHVTNPEVDPLDQVYAFFPNDCQKREENGKTNLAVHAVRFLPNQIPAGQDRYHWAYDGPPQRRLVGGQELIELVYSDALRGSDPEPNRQGKALFAEKVEPAGLSQACRMFFTRTLQKTVIGLRLLPQLKGGESGWLRLLVYPNHEKLEQAKVRHRCQGSHAGRYQWLTVASPPIIRDQVRQRLRGYEPEKQHEEPVAGPVDAAILAAEEAERFLFKDGVEKKGTSTRVEDHRVAVLACGAVEIESPNCTTGAMDCGPLRLLADDITGLLWYAGSNETQHREWDLIHNVRRVLDRVEHAKEIRPNDLVYSLQPPGKHESFSVLIEEMKKAQLLTQHDSKPGLDWDQPVFLPDHRQDGWQRAGELMLRKKYSHPKQVLREMGEEHWNLFDAFTDIHPFLIYYRVSW